MPGIFAAGDVRHRSLERVASAVGEGSAAATQVYQHLREAQAKSRREERVTACADIHTSGPILLTA